MKSFYIVCTLLYLFGLMACKPDTATQTVEAVPQTTQEDPQNSAQVPSNQSNRTALSGGHDYTFLTDKLFHYKAAYSGNKDSKDQPFKDEWIDLTPDGKYKAGKLKAQTHTGQWSYNHETKTLFLKPDIASFKMSEWKVMYNEQMMVWVGTQTYGNNNTQIQLVKSDVLP